MAGRGEESEGGGVPEDCISHVLSLTTPRDSCRAALVSAAFRSAASSDAVWERFLPSDYQSILSRAVEPVEYSSKRELYFRLCDSILVDGGRLQCFQLERSTGGKCYMICPRSMRIIWGDEPRYWSWISLPESRFAEVARLQFVCWFDIGGRIDCRLLSPRTTYAAYLVFKLDSWSSGLGPPPHLASVKLGAYASEFNICLEDHDDRDEEEEEEEEGRRQRQRRRLRDDGWMEIELGVFYNDEGDDGDVEMSLMEVKALNSKHGLIVQGLEVRPKI
ncbi:F-box protein PP2-B10-like isoform X1 [Phoenix dactylifera]|uniref:F-box protein PP2-B10-like isoform X1 n=1 Tax=Phoenix dactylifera TaxID=42345 RepID=A0A8B8ZD67_PHODC|nr:F-box protein PP2-B10-like isoform X1 [Phoenix dactylifera]XP_038972052.1 F-box protein PP2-B10-like isoform X1 [Phoenix dactylifera]